MTENIRIINFIYNATESLKIQLKKLILKKFQ